MELKLKAGFDIAIDQRLDGEGWIMYIRGNYKGIYIPILLTHDELLRMKNALNVVTAKMRF